MVMACETCNGTGEIEVPIGLYTGDPRVDDWDEDTCPDCNGSGEIETQEEE